MSGGRSAASSAAKNVGPEKNSVGRCSATIRATSAGDGRLGSSTVVAPAQSGNSAELPSP